MPIAHTSIRTSRSCPPILWLAALCIGLWVNPSSTFAQTPNCSSLFQSKSYLKAARCFEAKANAMGKTSRLSKIQRYLKGQALRNAALSYKNAAKGIKNIELAAFRRSLALKILRRYLKENLCQRAYLCKLAKGETLELINLINYTQLSIVTSPGKPAHVELSGYKFKTQHISPPQWNKKVRPGRYKIVVKYEGKKPIPKEIFAPPGQSVTVTMLMAAPVRVVGPVVPPPKPSAPIYPWIIAGVGGAAALAGGALLIVAQIKVSERDDLALALRNTAKGKDAQGRIDMVSENAHANRTKPIEDAHKTAASLILPGWILVGAGAAVLTTGIILAAVIKPSTKAPPKNPPAKTKSNSFLATF